LKAAGARFEMHQYPGTKRRFNNDTTPRVDSAARKQVWERTLAFFRQHLGKSAPLTRVNSARDITSRRDADQRPGVPCWAS